MTPFGGGALVAGGKDSRTNEVLDEAEVYDPTLGGFDQQHRITLSMNRASAGAAVLATGETLLVGGVGVDGVTAVDSMEAVDPATRTVRAEGVARLKVARTAPVVLRLASGEVLVAGGFDGAGNPVPTLEWFSADASRASRPAQDLVAGSARAYAALQGGGALAVIAPPAGAPATFQNTWVIDADGNLEAAMPLGGSLTAPQLFGGAGGAPILWTGPGGDGSPGRWLRWQPWASAFGTAGVVDDVPPNVSATATSPDPGLAMWLDVADATTPKLTALRFDVQGEYSPLAGPLLITDASQMAPDRMAAPGALSFDSSEGLVLAPGATALVTDRTYADVRVEVDAPTAEPAWVVLRDGQGNEIEVGGAGCPVGAPSGSSAGASVAVERRGTGVTWSTGNASGSCPAALAASTRLSVGLRGASGRARSVARDLRVTRLAAP